MRMPAVAESVSAKVVPQRITLKVFDQEFTFRTDLPGETVHGLGRMVDENLRSVARRYPDLPPLKAAIMAALYLAEELQELRQEYDSLVALIEEEKK